METTWNEIHITDKSGVKLWKTTASELSTPSELRNLKQHLDNAIKYPNYYNFLDIDTAQIILNGEVYKEVTLDEINLDDLL